MARYHATVEPRRSATGTFGAVPADHRLGPASRGGCRGRIKGWRRQGGTAWLLLGHLSVGQR